MARYVGLGFEVLSEPAGRWPAARSGLAACPPSIGPGRSSRRVAGAATSETFSGYLAAYDPEANISSAVFRANCAPIELMAGRHPVVRASSRRLHAPALIVHLREGLQRPLAQPGWVREE